MLESRTRDAGTDDDGRELDVEVYLDRDVKVGRAHGEWAYTRGMSGWPPLSLVEERGLHGYVGNEKKEVHGRDFHKSGGEFDKGDLHDI